ncbi:DNA-binding SARP family transcriptional activator/Tfp pilus assembly protein PilF [Micromonospora luteifusca]|uniref:DNA-binding SARP family transcriptional activator/Tfp pilus assembly protein PilF n=1 Tax=Micromonospora luteifusca TaxID=709860 RepID=A0ABS2M1N0_9ACTN|nr:BTAD domain-containing putative transcriptional regulator [Micromonospora luteifusca]MBM7494286.1 DNA-binding SARP family transcriptional activator/Tfp pilus assembly protein PilF [Micromonospora luteifusca]
MAGRSIELTGKQRALLGALLLDANHVVSVQRITDRLWGEDPPVSAPARVRALVAELRRACGPEGAELIETRNPGYLLRVGDGEFDAPLFVGRVESARRATFEGRPQEAIADYDGALALWRGAPLAGLRGPHVEAEAARLTEYRTAALEGRAEAMMALGRFHEAVAELTLLVAENQFRERSHRLLMLALYSAGRAAEALKVYRDFRARLVAELGVEPTGELRSLHQRVLAGAAGPERPYASAPTRVPRELPADIGRFVGREAELKQLDGLAAGGGRVLLVVGPAGAGKTALAVHWAHRAARDFPDGQIFLGMRGFDPGQQMSPTEALPVLLQALGQPPKDIPADLQTQGALYRSLLAERRILLVLDNVASAEQARPILPGGPGCLVVMTSRDRLGGLVAREGASRLGVAALELEEALALLAHGVGADRLRAEPEAAVQLAVQCGQMPLALSIAGARLAEQRHHTVGGYVAELADRGRLARLRVDGDEHTAVRAALDLSYRALSLRARRMFRLMSLAPSGGLATASAAALAGVDRGEAEELLDSVARVHLVTEVGVHRFAAHDLLLEYAAERVAEEDSQAERRQAVQRLMSYYLYSAVEAARVGGLYLISSPPTMIPPGVTPEAFGDRSQALAWLDDAWQEITAAVHLSAELDSRPMACLLVIALQDYLHHFRPLAESVRMATIGLAAAEGSGDLSGQAAMRLSLGHTNWRMTRLVAGGAEYKRALVLARRANWRRGEADALRGIGVILKQLGRPQQALNRYRRSIRLDHALDNARGESSGLNNLASAYLELGRLGPAERCLTACIPVAERAGNLNMQAIVLVNIGLVRQEQGQLAAALHWLDRALAIARNAGMPYSEAITYETVGRVHNHAGRWPLAAEAHQAALLCARRAENLNCQVDALVGLAEAAVGQGRIEDALARLAAAAAITDRTGYHAGRVEMLIGLGRATLSSGRPDRAYEHGTEALRLAVQGNPLALGRAHATLAAILVELGEAPRAVVECRRALRVSRRSGQWLGYANALIPLGRARRLVGDERAARTAWGRAHRHFVELGIPRQDETAALLG